ncbi:MAG: hypothetical protein HDT23_00735 [Ruminococcus sp.]|nr:hypothetical protein [Ruminococcus sp.]
MKIKKLTALIASAMFVIMVSKFDPFYKTQMPKSGTTIGIGISEACPQCGRPMFDHCH